MAPALKLWTIASRSALVVLLLPQCSLAKDRDGCTSIAISSGATVDGSVMASHANDCQDCDFRMVYVPARDHAVGSRRIIYDAIWSQYPRLVDPDRSSQYQAAEGITSSKVLGHIPEVAHTFAIWESTYGLMNEKGVGMGESTCAAFLVGNGTSGSADGGALFTIGNLMAVALERCQTARCAIHTMGELGSKYGFFGEDPGQSGSGEAVTVVDNTSEAWVFHITGGLPPREGSIWEGQRGALWAAQRVPNGHVAVVANNFIIREVDPEDTENFIVHPGLFDLAQEAGLWDGRGALDFQLAMAPDMRNFSYNPVMPPIPMYTTMRMWGVFRAAAPSLNIAITDDASLYPFSVPVDKKVSHLDVMDWFRSHYEGTEFDMRLGALAGPWQTPNRVEGGIGQLSVPGEFARGTSIPRTSYTELAQSGIPQPVVWFAPDASASSVFVPFFASTLSGGADNKFDVQTYGTGSMKSFSFTSGELPNAWWAFDFVANWMDLSYKNMSETYVYPKVHELQREVASAATAAVADAARETSDDAVAAVLAAAQTRVQRHVVEEWWRLAGKLVVRYNDHTFNFPEHAPTEQAGIGYPAFWLEMIGYSKASYYPTWFQQAQSAPSLLPAAELAVLKSSASSVQLQSATATAVVPVVPNRMSLEVMVAAVCLALTSSFAGYFVGRAHERQVAAAAEIAAPYVLVE